MKKLCVAYHMPYPTTIYATRYIYIGFKNAFEDLGHKFVTYGPDQNLKKFLDTHQPDLFITASHFFYRKSLDYDLLKQYRAQGMVLLTKIDFWDSPLNKNRINEAPSMKDDKVAKRLIKAGLLGDYYFSTGSQQDKRLIGFSTFYKQGYTTIPLAADKITLKPVVDHTFDADISFLGTNLPQKREFFKEWLYPLAKDYDLKLYGQDWTRRARLLGYATKVGQYFNVPVLKSLQKPPLQPSDEAKIYANAKILVNLHEDYQRKFGGDCNERTFKIPFCGGLEVCDDVAVVHDYFKEDSEIVIAHDKADWFDKIKYYYDNPKLAHTVAEAGRKRVLKEHTYHNRAKQILELVG
jgi:spore maturation protein CgeB